MLILRYIFYILLISPLLSSFLILSSIYHSHSKSGAVVNVESAIDNNKSIRSRSDFKRVNSFGIHITLPQFIEDAILKC